GKGHFILPEKLNLVINSNLTEIKEIVAQFSAHIKTATGYDLNVINNGNKKSSGIHLFINDKNDDAIGDEGYHLTVGADGVMLNANKPAGLYYGLKTLIQ